MRSHLRIYFALKHVGLWPVEMLGTLYPNSPHLQLDARIEHNVPTNSLAMFILKAHAIWLAVLLPTC